MSYSGWEPITTFRIPGRSHRSRTCHTMLSVCKNSGFWMRHPRMWDAGEFITPFRVWGLQPIIAFASFGSAQPTRLGCRGFEDPLHSLF